ncbi:CgeB family protein [Cupriavidus sp. CP313]
MLKILYLGSLAQGSTSLQRARALQRIGHGVTMVDPYVAASFHIFGRLGRVFHYRTGYRLLQTVMLKWISKIILENEHADVIWVDNGELFGKESVRLMSSKGGKVVLYNHDDPTGKRDGNRFASLLNSISLYDVCAVVREANVQEFLERGARNVVKIWMGYDEIEHAPLEDLASLGSDYRSDVAFIGTWMRHEGRDRFLLDLASKGINIAIWGARWHRSPVWKELRPFYRGGAIRGRDYVAAIQGAKVCLGMLSKGNRDLHTTRTMEIPFAGGLLCAERTSEHTFLYREGEEAVFWENVDECAFHCKRLLTDSSLRERIVVAGMKKVRALEVGHEDACHAILRKVQEEPFGTTYQGGGDLAR